MGWVGHGLSETRGCQAYTVPDLLPVLGPWASSEVTDHCKISANWDGPTDPHDLPK